MKSIFFRIFNSFILIILLTILLTVTVEFLYTRNNIPLLLTEERTKNISHFLGSAYTREKQWNSLADEINLIGQANTYEADDSSMRIIIRDMEGKTLYNSFSQINTLSDSPLVEGDTVAILDYGTGETAGTVTAYIDKNYLESETFIYILTLLKPRLLQGCITIIIASFAASLLSRRITRPITALTKAAEVISTMDDTPPLPVDSDDELGQMSRSFNRMLESLVQQKNLRKRLTGDISHEILTPLNHIRLEAKGLLDGISTPSSGAPRIINEVDHMKHLVYDLDWLAETDSGEYRLRRQWMPIEHIISEEVKNWALKGRTEGKEVVLSNLPEGSRIFNVDPLRLSQALGNLIDNALKYSSDKSTVTVSCSMEKDQAVISVMNSGDGIREEDRPFLFERFYRADQARTPDRSGRGLGLSIVKQIINLHGGRVWFESRNTEETVFSISLPYRDVTGTDGQI